MKRPHVALFLLLASLQIAVSQPFASTNAPPGASGGPEYVPGEVLIKFRSDVTDEQIATAFRGASLRFLKQVQTTPMRDAGQIGITHAATVVPVEQALAVLRQVAGIEYAEPNWIYTHQGTSTDPYFTSGKLWGMYGDDTSPMNMFGSQAAEAWINYVGSRSVVVGVIDTGIQISHPDLDGNVWVNNHDPVNNMDDDDNGYVDDFNGWDFFENNNSVYDSTDDDHGTHVAGTIGAEANQIGVVGVNWEVGIISAKFLGPNGGTTDAAIRAVDYFTALKLKGTNIVALNNSWGGGGYSQGLHDAIIRAAKAGILFVAAAGNGNRVGKAVNIDTTPYYPASYKTDVGTTTESAASYDSVITVTAIDSSGNKASWANYGPLSVDLGAPGVDINSTLPLNSYGTFSGTSMATPHVTGAIALYASTHAGAWAPDIKQAILDAVAPTASLQGKTSTGGRLDLSTVITPTKSSSTAPLAPSGLTATAVSSSDIHLTWNDNSEDETRFVITRDDSVQFTVGANTVTFTDSGLTPGTTYTYTIEACNAAGCSLKSSEAFATTQVVPRVVATPLSDDNVTKGNWIGKYGAQAYHIVSYSKALLSSIGTLSLSGNASHLWASRTGDARALLAPNGRSRFAACHYSQSTDGSFYYDVNLVDGKAHRVSLYLLDWDRQNRIETIEVVDRNYDQVLVSASGVAGFSEGRYLSWNVTGPVLIKVKWVDNLASVGDNAVVSGIFIDPAQ